MYYLSFHRSGGWAELGHLAQGLMRDHGYGGSWCCVSPEGWTGEGSTSKLTRTVVGRIRFLDAWAPPLSPHSGGLSSEEASSRVRHSERDRSQSLLVT